MKLSKSFWARTIPIFIVVVFTVLSSVAVYQRMMQAESENCWERLEIATRSTAGKIQVRLNDNLNFLEAVADSFILTHNLDEEKEVGRYLTSVMKMTIFERIDILLPNGYLLTQQGEKVSPKGTLSYEEILEKGTHISPRCTDAFSGEEVLYCFTPIDFEGEIQALLCGTIDCQTLGDLFQVFTYGQEAQLFLIDRADGNYLMDNWHNQLDNVYNLGLRQSIDEKEMIDLAESILKEESERVTYVSKTNGENSYQFQAPVEGFNWIVCVVVQEDVAFAHVNELKQILFSVGLVEVALLFIYLAWNIWLSAVTAKSEEKNRKLEMEKATNEAKARFISNMSHDIRTPLNGIVGMLHIIKNHRQNDVLVNDCLSKIEVSTQYLSTLANDMLDINEIESNKLVLEDIPINLCKMADELGVMVELKAKDAEVVYDVDYSGVKNPYVLGSEIHIQRILVNLIGNAIKYSKEENAKVWLIIDETETDKQQSTYSFAVKDNGIGMTQEFQKDMYSAFAQEKVSARSSYQGYGLGLTIVYQLVKKMGGNITLESKKGEGSIFTVTLPLKHDTAGINQQEELTDVDLTGVNVLLVEDNEFNREIAEVLLTDAGVNVVSAVNGKMATEIYAAARPYAFDMILMDLMMPEMDGYEATEVIRNMGRADAKQIPIIAMTASAFAEEIKRCKEVGMNEHIAKPLDIHKLMVQIAKYYQQSPNNKK